METKFANMGATMKTLENHIGKLALAMKENSSRSFPSDTKKNLRECKAITLRSGKQVLGLKVVDEG